MQEFPRMGTCLEIPKSLFVFRVAIQRNFQTGLNGKLNVVVQRHRGIKHAMEVVKRDWSMWFTVDVEAERVLVKVEKNPDHAAGTYPALTPIQVLGHVHKPAALVINVHRPAFLVLPCKYNKRQTSQS